MSLTRLVVMNFLLQRSDVPLSYIKLISPLDKTEHSFLESDVWLGERQREREKVWYLGPDWKEGSRNLDGVNTSDDTEIKWDKEMVASTTIGFVKLHFPYISSHLSLSSLKVGDTIKNIKEKKKVRPLQQVYKKKRGKEGKGGPVGEHLFPLGTEVFRHQTLCPH